MSAVWMLGVNVGAQSKVEVERILIERRLGPTPYGLVHITLKDLQKAPDSLVAGDAEITRITTAKGHSYSLSCARTNHEFHRRNEIIATFPVPVNTRELSDLEGRIFVRPPGQRSRLTFGVGNEDVRTNSHPALLIRHIRSENLGFSTRAEFELELKGYSGVRDDRERTMPELLFRAVDAKGKECEGTYRLYAKAGDDQSEVFRVFATYEMSLDTIRRFYVDVQRLTAAAKRTFTLEHIPLAPAGIRAGSVSPQPAMVQHYNGYCFALADVHLYYTLSASGKLLGAGSGFELQVSAVPSLQERLRQLVFPDHFSALDDRGKEYLFERCGRTVNPYVMRVKYRCTNPEIAMLNRLRVLNGSLQDLTGGKRIELSISFTALQLQSKSPGKELAFWDKCTAYLPGRPGADREQLFIQLLQCQQSLPTCLLPEPPWTDRRKDYWRISSYAEIQRKQDTLRSMNRAEKRTPRTGIVRVDGFTAAPCGKQPEIDGDLADWILTTQVIACEGGKGDGKMFRCDLAFMFDAQALYVGADWTDITPMGNRIDSTRCALLSHLGDSLQFMYRNGDTPWQADCSINRSSGRSTVYIHPSQSKHIPMQPGFGAFYSSTDRLLGDGVEQAFKVKSGTTPGYIQEIRIPWTCLGLPSPELNSSIPSMLRLTWGNYQVERQLLVNSGDTPAHAFWPFETAQAFGTLRFASSAPTTNVQRRLTISKLEGKLTPMASFETQPDMAVALAFTGEEGILLVGEAGGVRTVNPYTGRAEQKWHCGEMRVRAAGLSHNRRMLAVAGNDRSLTIWELSSRRKLLSLSGAKKNFTAVVFSHADLQVAATSFDGHVRVWDLKTGRVCADIDCGRALRCLEFSPNDHLLCAAGLDRKVRVWDARDWKLKHELSGHEFGIRTVGFSADDSVISGADDMSLRVWDLKTGKVRGTLTGHASLLTDHIVLDGNRVISCAFDSNVIAWDLNNGKMAAMQAIGKAGLVHLAISPSGKRLAVLDRAGKVSILEHLR